MTSRFLEGCVGYVLETRPSGRPGCIKEAWLGGAGGESDREFSLRTSRVWDACLSSRELSSSE